MKWAVRLALGLYPPRWRRRYGRELEALAEDSGMGWRGALDIARGAVAMQIREFRTIPLLAALIGASIGAAMYWRAPALYTSSSTILLTGVNFAEPKSGGRWVQKTLFPVNPGEDALRATTVALLTAGGESGFVKISYSSRDAKGAQDAVKKLVAAAVNGSGDAGARGTVIETPVLPTTAQRPRSAGVVPAGAGLGLVLGTAFVVLRRVTGTPIAEA